MLNDAVSVSKRALEPCRSCELNPSDCKMQYQVTIPGAEDTMVMCRKKGVVREVASIKIPRNGKSSADCEILTGAEAAL